LSPWTGLRGAVEHGLLPPQSRSIVARDRNDPKTRGEACLTVTVWSPNPSGSLPVMVRIAGGAFLNGAGQLQLYDGARLAANGNVAVVNSPARSGFSAASSSTTSGNQTE
jgi:para-nitrobenzyl esterase